MTILSNSEVSLRTSSTVTSRPLMSSSASTVVFTSLSSLIKSLSIQVVRTNIVENGVGQQIAGAGSGSQRSAHERRRDVEPGHRNCRDAARRREMHRERLLHVPCRVFVRQRLGHAR